MAVSFVISWFCWNELGGRGLPYLAHFLPYLGNVRGRRVVSERARLHPVYKRVNLACLQSCFDVFFVRALDH